MQSFKIPKNDKKYHWTSHIVQKMLYYRISPSRVRRIVNAPDRVEESVVPNTIAAMKKFSRVAKEEFWIIYQLSHKKIILITTWRYPGKSPKRNPIPQQILDEIKNVTLL